MTTSSYAESALYLHEQISGNESEKVHLHASRYPALPRSLGGSNPLAMADLALGYLRIASHIVYEIAHACSENRGTKAPLILARASIEASANAHHLTSQIQNADDEFVREVLRERIWMARESGKIVEGGTSEFLEPLLRYAEANAILSRTKPGDSDTKFSKDVANRRGMTQRVEALFPEAPNSGFHYGWLSGFAHVNPSSYFMNLDGNEFVLGFGSALTALRSGVEMSFLMLGIPFDDAWFNFWPTDPPFGNEV